MFTIAAYVAVGLFFALAASKAVLHRHRTIGAFSSLNANMVGVWELDHSIADDDPFTSVSTPVFAHAHTTVNAPAWVPSIMDFEPRS